MPTTILQPPSLKTRLDTRETSFQGWEHGRKTFVVGQIDAYHTFRHASWCWVRKRTAKALSESKVSRNARARFATCGSGARLYRHKEDPNKYQIRSHTCRSRWCTPCSRERGRAIATTLAELVGTNTVRFVTLTLKTTTEPLAESLAHLTKSFTRLRRSKLWRSTQAGGAAFLEVKWNPLRDRWHPHLHILVAGKYMPKQQLSEQWKIASGTSYIVDIQLVKNRKDLCNYVTKYVTKSVSTSVTRDEARFIEAINAMHGKRTCATFGSWRGSKLVEKPESDDWEYIGTWEDVVASSRFDPASDRYLALLNFTKHPEHTEWGNDNRAPPEQDPNDRFYTEPNTVA